MAVILSATSATSGDATWTSPGAATAFGNTLTVAESGGQYTAVETALAAAVAGDTVLVYPGVYDVPVAGYVVPDSVSLIGVDRQTVVFNASGNAPLVAVTLNGNSLVEKVRITLADAVAPLRIGVSMTGAQGVVRDVEFGAVTATNGQIGISVTAGNCSIYDPIARGPALATFITVGASGVARVFNPFTQASIVCTPTLSFIENTAGVLFIVGGSLTLGALIANRTLRGVSAGGIFTEIHALILEVGESDYGFYGVTGGILYTFACRCDSANIADYTGDAAAILYRSQGDFFGIVSVAQANAASRLPDARGTAVVPNGLALVTIAAATIGGAAYDGHTVFATLREADGVITVANCTWSGGGALTIRTTAVVTADRDVSWFIPG